MKNEQKKNVCKPHEYANIGKLPYKIAKFSLVLTPVKKQQLQLLFLCLGSNTCPESLTQVPKSEQSNARNKCLLNNGK